MSTPESSNNKSPAPGLLPRDPNYYYQDENTVLLVGGVLFKVRPIDATKSDTRLLLNTMKSSRHLCSLRIRQDHPNSMHS
jgi:hypothetical protein